MFHQVKLGLSPRSLPSRVQLYEHKPHQIIIKERIMRTFKFLSVLLVLAIVLAACTSGEPAAEEKTVKVALLFPMSGDVVTFGESSRDGVLLAIDEWNAKGGPAGYKIEYTIEDSQCSADPARNAANKVASEGIKYILGEVCSKASIPVSEIAEEKGIIQISPTSTNATVTQSRWHHQGLRVPRLLYRSFPGSGGRQVCPRESGR
jgi:ABC-type branched-subunit amino acid transport system substrate-binding protein